MTPARFLDIPDVRQPDNFSCGSCCAQAVATYFGVGPKTRKEWNTALGTNVKKSTDPKRIIAYLQSLGLNAVGRQKMITADLLSAWQSGSPVIVPIQEYGIPSKQASFDYGHYVVVIGVDHGYVTVNDPSYDNTLEGEDSDAAPGRMIIPIDRFLSVWHDRGADGTNYFHYGITVSKPSSSTAEKLKRKKLARLWAERFPGYHTSRFATPVASYTATLHHVKPVATNEPSFESDLHHALPEYGFQFSQDSTDKDQGDMHATGVGHAASVFRNAAGLAKDALHRFTPGALTFSASEPSRQRLYDALAGKVALVHPDYTGYKITRGDSTHYALVHKSHVPAYFTTAAKHGLTPEALNTVRPGSRARLARGVRMTVDKAGRPDTGRRTARLVLYDHSLNRAAMRALINTSKFGYHAMHGGGVNNSYGYPAETDSVLSAATVHPDGIRVSQWYGRLPANKVTVGGAAAAAAGDPAVGNLFHDGRTEATRQAARRTVRQLHSARVRSGTHTANIVIPRDVLKAFHDFRDSPGVFADYAEEHGLISTDHANVIRANPSDETMASVVLRPETIENAKPKRYIVPQVRKPRVTTDPNDFAHSPATRLARRFNTNLGDWREAIRAAPEQNNHAHDIIADKLADDEDSREDIVRQRRQCTHVTPDIHAREPGISTADIDAADPLTSTDRAHVGRPNTLYIDSPTDTSAVHVFRFKHPQFTHGPYYRVTLHAGPSHMYTALWDHRQYNNWRSTMDEDERKRFTFPDEQQVRKLAAIPPAGSGSVVVRVPTPTPVASTRPAPRPQPTFILPG